MTISHTNNKMGKNKGIMALVAASMVLVATVGCSTNTTQAATTTDIIKVQADQPLIAETINSEYFTNKEQNFDYETEGAYKVSLNGNTITGDNISVSGSTMTITSPGVYIISGTLNNGQIIVNNPESGHVQLVLNNVSISSTDTAAIWVQESDKTIITLPEGTVNTISDGGTYVDGDDLPSATIFSKDDLVVNGKGTLTVNANLRDGITSRDDLKILGATINLTSVDDGIVGKDSVAITNANINITSAAEGIKSSNDTEEGKGVVYIDGGKYTINAGNDGIQGITLVEVASGDLLIKAVDDGIHSDGKVVISGGIIDVAESYEGIEGLNITINEGAITVVSSDDGINVTGGTDSTAGGTEGQRGAWPAGERPNRGNAPADMSETPNKTVPSGVLPNDNQTSQSTTETTAETTPFNVANIEKGLTINGGSISVTVGGDGIDINGSGVMNGGTVEIYGSTSGADGALDFDGSFVVNGGTLVAFGQSQMAMAPSTSEIQNTISANFEQNQNANTKVTIKNSSGVVIGEYTSVNAFQNMIFSSSELKTGENYKIFVNDEEYNSFSISAGTTYVNKNGVTVAQNSRGMGGMKNKETQTRSSSTVTGTGA